MVCVNWRASRTKVVAEHNALFEAIRQRDVKQGRHLVDEPIEAGKEYIFSAIFD
jgi:DNA-binding FadR family transcriptional regulator